MRQLDHSLARRLNYSVIENGQDDVSDWWGRLRSASRSGPGTPGEGQAVAKECGVGFGPYGVYSRLSATLTCRFPHIHIGTGLVAKDRARGTGANLVLIVEDYLDAREMYADYLRHHGYGVEEASGGVEAIEKCTRLVPDVVVMDMALPDLDGWEATRRLKAQTATAHIPIVALTGHAMEEHERRARDVGCDAFLRKPCLPNELLDVVAKFVRRGKR